MYHSSHGRHRTLLLVILLVFIRADSAVAKPLFYNRVVALCFGVDTYKSGFESLSTAHADAQLIAQVFRERFGYETVVPDDSKNTRQGILELIQETASRLTENDALIVYFAGHGVAFQARTNVLQSISERVGFLVPYGAKFPFSIAPRVYNNEEYLHWNNECLNMRQFVDDLSQLKVHHVLLIADSCCSGFLINRGLAELKEIGNLFTRKSFVVVSATDQMEAAVPQIFTPALIEILEKHSRQRNVVSVTDVFEELRSTVPPRIRGEMTPRMGPVADSRGEFLFFPSGIRQQKIDLLRKEITAALKRPKKKIGGMGFTLLDGVVKRMLQRAGRTTKMSELVAAINAPNYWYGADPDRQLKRWREQRKRFHENAAMGDPLAMAGLHFCYAKGLGEPTQKPNIAEAFRWAQEANLVTDAGGLGKYLLSRCHRRGWGVTKNEVHANQLIRESANEGFVVAQITRAEQLFLENNANAAALAERLLRPGLQERIPNASVVMADAFARGDRGVAGDLKRAISLYESVFSNDFPWPCVVLYDAYGAGLPGYPEPDKRRSINYLRQGAEVGVSTAQFYLAVELCHLPKRRRILNLPRNTGEGKQWLEMAARQKNIDALLVQAQLYADGKQPGFRADAKKAKAALQVAVDLGDPVALATQGWWYLDKPEMYPRNEKKAMQLLKRAALLNDALGCALLGEMYQKGQGLEIRVARFQMHAYTHVAMHWYMKAIQNGGNASAERELKQFAGLYRLELGGRPYDRKGLGPTAVVRSWKKAFPKTEAAFQTRYLRNRPG